MCSVMEAMVTESEPPGGGVLGASRTGSTCAQINFCRPLPVAQNSELRELHLVAHAHATESVPPEVANIAHCVSDSRAKQEQTHKMPSFTLQHDTVHLARATTADSRPRGAAVRTPHGRPVQRRRAGASSTLRAPGRAPSDRLTNCQSVRVWVWYEGISL